MFSGLRDYGIADHNCPSASKGTRRSCWRLLNAHDDTVAGPGPSSAAAAIITAASSCRRSARTAAGISGRFCEDRLAVWGTMRNTCMPTLRLLLRASPQEASLASSNERGMPSCYQPYSPEQHGKPNQRGISARSARRAVSQGSRRSRARTEAASSGPADQESGPRTFISTRAAAAESGDAGDDSYNGSSRRSHPVKSILDIAAASARSGDGNVGFRRGDRGDSGGSASITAYDGVDLLSEANDGDDTSTEAGGPRAFPIRLQDGRQLVKVMHDTPSAAAASALSHALGVEQRAVVRFDGGSGALKGLRTLTLANIFMGGYQRALSFVVDVKQVSYGRPSPLETRPQSGDVSYMYRVMARARSLLRYDRELPMAIREARFLLDLSINVRQAWDMKGDVDEEQAYDLADTLYGALSARQAEEDASDLSRHQHLGWRGNMEKAAVAGLQSDLRHDDGRLYDGREKRGRMRGGDEGRQRRVAEMDSRRQQRRHQWQQREDERPWIIVTADLGQGPTLLTALGLLQKRLREERQKAVVETTLYRASVAAPRINGKDGWVYVIGLGFEVPYMPSYVRLRRAQDTVASSARQFPVLPSPEGFQESESGSEGPRGVAQGGGSSVASNVHQAHIPSWTWQPTRNRAAPVAPAALDLPANAEDARGAAAVDVGAV